MAQHKKGKKKKQQFKMNFGGQPLKKTTYKPTKQQPRTVLQAKGNRNLIYGICIVVITLIVYCMSLSNGFVKNWDDGGYVVENKYIKELTAESVKDIFTPTTFYKGNYHPLTTLIYSVEYQMVGASPFLYHLINLLLHLINVLLVYQFIRLLSGRIEIAAITALLFGIHPMHVESVAWISELKDVLYTMFFLAAMISYLRYYYSKSGKKKYYINIVVFFILSLFSKSAAVALPVALLCVDYFLKRRFTWKLLLEKVPFFILSLAFGFTAILSQGEKDAIQDLTPMFSYVERLMISSYSLMIYFYKLIVPVDLSAMYPYPGFKDGKLPMLFYIAPAVIFIIALLVYFSKRLGRYIIFGVLFFLVTIALVLQLLPVGGAILAERYTYVPYIGLFFVIAKIVVDLNDKKSKIALKIKPVVNILLVVAILVYSYLSFERIKIWKNGEVLFTDLIRKNPNLPFAYNNRGYFYYKYQKNYDKALKDYTKTIELDNNFHRAFSNRGVLYFNTNEFEKAIADFSRALELKSNNTDALIGRANTYSSLKQYAQAIPDYDKYLLYKKDDKKAFLWRGTAKYHVEKLDEATVDFDRIITMDPNWDEGYYWKALVYIKQNEVQQALNNLDKAIKLNPMRSDAYTWRGILKKGLSELQDAIDDFTHAIKLNPNDVAAYVNRATTYYDIHKYYESYNDLLIARNTGYPVNEAFFMKVKVLAGR